MGWRIRGQAVENVEHATTTTRTRTFLVSGHEQQIFFPDLPRVGAAGATAAGGGGGDGGADDAAPIMIIGLFREVFFRENITNT